MAWRNAKNLNQILHFWNLWVKGFQTIYRLSKSVDILEEALTIISVNSFYFQSVTIITLTIIEFSDWVIPMSNLPDQMMWIQCWPMLYLFQSCFTTSHGWTFHRLGSENDLFTHFKIYFANWSALIKAKCFSFLLTWYIGFLKNLICCDHLWSKPISAK